MKPRRCKTCKEEYTPRSPMQTACSPSCALSQAKLKREKAEAKAKKEEKRQDREKKERLKTRSDWIKDAQRQFNAYIRLRDAGKQCVSCNVLLLAYDTPGGVYDCGHFRSVGSAPNLRFNPNNAAGQCKKCNRYGAGRVVEYRKSLIERIGLEAVERLEADNVPRKYSIEDLKAIKEEYKRKAKELEKQLCES